MPKRSLSVLGLLGLVLIVCSFASPAVAAAKSRTYLPKKVVVDAVSFRGTAQLTYAKGSKRPGVAKRYVKIYRWDARTRRWKYLKQSKTNSAGYFTVVLPSGRSYRLYFPGDKTRRSTWSPKLTVTKSPALTDVSASQSAYTLDPLGTTTSASGELESAVGGVPVGGATLWIWQLQPDTTYAQYVSFTTDSFGHWTVVGLPMGSYRIDYAGDASHKPAVGYFTVVYPSVQTQVGITSVSGDPVTVMGNVSADLTAYGGSVASPLLGGTVDILQRQPDNSYTPAGSATIDASGVWIFTGLSAGDYKAVSRPSADAISGGGHYAALESQASFTVPATGP